MLPESLVTHPLQNRVIEFKIDSGLTAGFFIHTHKRSYELT